MSPEAAKVRKEVAKEKWEARLSEEAKARLEAAQEEKKLKKDKKKRQKAERKMQGLQNARQVLESMGPVRCQLCSKEFGTPGDYAQHLESGTHPNVKRQNVTQAVNMLGVIPPISLTPSIEFSSSADTGSVTASTITPFTSPPSSPGTGGFASVAGSPLGGTTALPGTMIVTSPLSSGIFEAQDTRSVYHTNSPFDPTITYTPNDFLHLGIPYACALCFKTFRDVVQLTAHMNSPVHDPDAFKCPNPKCGQQFALVSGLIQHLESGRCKLASGAEIFERFALMTAKFSKYLVA